MAPALQLLQIELLRPKGGKECRPSRSGLTLPISSSNYGVPIGSSMPLQRQPAAASRHNSPNKNTNIIRTRPAGFKRSFLKIEVLRVAGTRSAGEITVRNGSHCSNSDARERVPPSRNKLRPSRRWGMAGGNRD